MDNLKRRLDIEVKVAYDHVLLIMGQVTFDMQYIKALKVSQWLRVAAKQSQGTTGLWGLHWSLMPLLSKEKTDEEIVDCLKRTADDDFQVTRKPIAISVKAVSDKVVMNIGNVPLEFSIEQALTISRWLRLAVKQCKSNVGHVGRIWSAVGTLTDAAANG